MKRKNLGLLSYAVTLGLIILIAVIFNSNMPQAASKRIEYPELLRMIERDEVAKVAIRDQSLWGLKRRSNVLTAAFPEQDYDFETTIGEDFLLTVRQMAAEKKGKDVSQISVADLTFDVQYRKAEETSWLITFLPFILEILIFGVLIFMFLRANAGAGRAMHFGKSNPHIQVGNESKVTFADVAGASCATHASIHLSAHGFPRVSCLWDLPEPEKRCWPKQSPGKRGCRSSPSQAQTLLKCMSVSAQAVCVICLSRQSMLLRQLSSSMKLMQSAAAAVQVWAEDMMKGNRP